MALPFLIIPAGIATVDAIRRAIRGASNISDAKRTENIARRQHDSNLKSLEFNNNITMTEMDALASLELQILNEFDDFSDLMEQIHSRPIFVEYSKNNVNIPTFTAEDIRSASIGAGVILGGLGGTAVGTAGGFAAAGATSAAVMALGTASTGVPIASLSGAAAVNATLAALGGGAVAAGGGGMALGSIVLGVSSSGIGLLFGAAILDFAGKKISDKADQAWDEMLKAEEKICEINVYLKELYSAARVYRNALMVVQKIYKEHLNTLKTIVNFYHKTTWDTFSKDEQLLIENTVLLVSLLYNMCKVELVVSDASNPDMKTVNHADINTAVEDATTVLEDNNWIPRADPDINGDTTGTPNHTEASSHTFESANTVSYSALDKRLYELFDKNGVSKPHSGSNGSVIKDAGYPMRVTHITQNYLFCRQNQYTSDDIFRLNLDTLEETIVPSKLRKKFHAHTSISSDDYLVYIDSHNGEQDKLGYVDLRLLRSGYFTGTQPNTQGFEMDETYILAKYRDGTNTLISRITGDVIKLDKNYDYIIHGQLYRTDHETGSIEIYNPKQQSHTVTGALPKKLYPVAACGDNLFVATPPDYDGSELYVYNLSSETLSFLLVYDPATQLNQLVGNVPEGYHLLLDKSGHSLTVYSLNLKTTQFRKVIHCPNANKAAIIGCIDQYLYYTQNNHLHKIRLDSFSNPISVREGIESDA